MAGSKPGERRGGRQKGTPNRRTANVLTGMMAAGQWPLEFLVALYRDEATDTKDRAWAANAAAPYVHPRLAPAAARIALDLPNTSTAQGVRDAMAAVVQAVARGEIAPAEGQSLVSVLEAQRKAIETADILPRLEALEASHDGPSGNAVRRLA